MRSSARLLVPLALICTLAGCATPTPEPTPTPTGFATEDEAFAAAEATYRGYVDASNQVDFSDPATAEDVYAWLTESALDASREEITTASAEGWRRTGNAEIVLLQPHALGEKATQATMDVCLDMSGVDVLDADGNSLVPDPRPGVQSIRVEFVRSESSETGYLIRAMGPREDGPECEP